MSHAHPGAHSGSGDCADFIDSIVYLLDNELDADDIARVKEHLDKCVPCLDRYDVQRTIKQVVARSCVESAPDGLRQRIRLSIQQVEVRVTEE